MSGTLSSLTIIILGFGILILVTKKEKRRADYLLLLWFLTFLIHLVTINQLNKLPPWWFSLNTAVAFLHGPLFYAYVTSLQKQKKEGVPPILFLGSIFLIGGVLSLLAQPIPFIVNAVVVSTFTFLTSRVLWKPEPNTPEFSPAILNWLRFLLIGMATLLLIPLIQLLISPAWLNQSNNLIAHLEKVMKADHLFLSPNLNLREVATHLDVNANHLSEAINVGSNGNFNDYVNSYRINAIRQRLADGEHRQLTFLAIALECGFNSKASFNRAFKKHLGMTPSKYLKTLDQK